MATSVSLEEVQREGHRDLVRAEFSGWGARGGTSAAARAPPRELGDAAGPCAVVYDERRVPDRPAFTESFPRVPEVEALVEAFVRGDYARVRALARPLAARSTDPEVRRAATTLVERTRPDPLALWLIALCAALLVTLSIRFLAFPSRPPQHAQPQSAPAAGTSAPRLGSPP